MLRRHWLPLFGFAAVAVAIAGAVVFVASDNGRGDGTSLTTPLVSEEEPGDDQTSAPPVLADGIEVRATVRPRTILFGDTVEARVDIVVDRSRVDPDSVRVAPDFVPWEIVGQPVRARRDSGAATHVRLTFQLRCTSSPCLPANESAALEFNRARVSYAPPGADTAERSTVGTEWPLLLVYSRFAIANLEGPVVGPATSNPWHADFLTLPAVTYRIPPAMILVPLVVLAGLLGLAGVVLGYVAVPRRSPAPPPEPEPEPEIVLTPLEQALVLLEDVTHENGAEDRRRALELVAEVLADEQPALANAARALAWSENEPRVEDTSGLASRVRTIIDLNGDGNAE